MNPTSGATIRADLNFLVEEAFGAESMLIGSRVMPPMGVDAKSGTYPKLQIAKGALLESVATERNTDGSYNEIRRQWTTDTYDCTDRGLEERVDDAAARDVARFFNAESVASRLTLRNVMQAHEVRVATAIMNATNFGAGTNSDVAYTVANKATISFVDDVLSAIRRVKANGARANSIVMSEAVFHRISTATLVKEFVRGSIQGNISLPINAANLAAAFAPYGISQVLIGDSVQNTAAKGQDKSTSGIWGNTYVWVGAVNAGATDPRMGGAGFTLVWNAEGGLFVTESYRDEKRRSSMVRVRQNTAEKITDATSGTLITTQYA